MEKQIYLEIEIFASSWEWREAQVIEYIVKQGGEIWEFHKNDRDHLPSKPHGHNKENGNKLNIYTGEMHHRFTNMIIGKLGKKELGRIQSRLRDAGFDLNS